MLEVVWVRYTGAVENCGGVVTYVTPGAVLVVSLLATFRGLASRAVNIVGALS